MTDLSRHAERIKHTDCAVEDFARSLADQMNIHDRSNEGQWIGLAMLTADYALYKYKKSAEIILSHIKET